MERPGEWVTLDEARRRLFTVAAPLPPVRIPLTGATGHVLVQSVVAPRDVPPFAASAMDGYALRAADTAAGRAVLDVVGSSGAGRPSPVPMAAGEAVAIATGGALPDGADAVCPVEDTSVEGATVHIGVRVEPGAFVRPAGSDTAAGAPVIAAGTPLSPAHVGVIASLGIPEVDVHPTPRVGVLATGDELVAPPAVPGPGQIYDANRPALFAAVRAAGFHVVDLGIVDDDPASLETALCDAVGRCDVVLTSGGVSVGTADQAKAVLTRLAPDTVQWLEVRIKPGKPFGFASIPRASATGMSGPSGADRGGSVPVLCLPGNPVSALVVFALLVAPALERMAGRPGRPPRTETAVADGAFTRPADGKLHAVRATVRAGHDGVLYARPIEHQESHQLAGLARANALALLDDGETVAVGDPVRVLVTAPGTVDVAGDREVGGAGVAAGGGGPS